MSEQERTPMEGVMHAVLARMLAEKGIGLNCMREAKNLCKSAGLQDGDAANFMEDVLPRAISFMTGACYVEMKWRNDAGVPAIVSKYDANEK